MMLITGFGLRIVDLTAAENKHPVGVQPGQITIKTSHASPAGAGDA
jgi:hypothetical protein